MAFFGLSALGPQNSFVASRAEIYNCALFDLDGRYRGVQFSEWGLITSHDIFLVAGFWALTRFSLRISQNSLRRLRKLTRQTSAVS
jgi:hypothetical protein